MSLSNPLWIVRYVGSGEPLFEFSAGKDTVQTGQADPAAIAFGRERAPVRLGRSCRLSATCSGSRAVTIVGMGASFDITRDTPVRLFRTLLSTS